MSLPLPFDDLTPDTVLNAVEAAGWPPDGSLLPLNSYENRVYQIGVLDREPVIAKFYRPGRWSDAAIGEEHAFLQELAELEIPVVPPLANLRGETLIHVGEHRLTVFPRRGGRSPDLENLDQLEWLGRFMGRIHAAGRAKHFVHRPELGPGIGREAIAFLLDEGFIPDAVRSNWTQAAEQLLTGIEAAFADCEYAPLRLHGDCHPGNILWTDAGPHFVDFDDCLTGPAIQDLWMLLSGERHEMLQQLDALLEGYETFAEFDLRELALVEALRGLRILQYAGWLARRWHDPAFPRAFPWFNTASFWDEHMLSLREQGARMHEPVLSFGPAGA